MDLTVKSVILFYLKGITVINPPSDHSDAFMTVDRAYKSLSYIVSKSLAIQCQVILRNRSSM